MNTIDKDKRKNTMQSWKYVLLIGITFGVSSGCTALQMPLDVVESVDLDRYTGKWYEIARYPHFFENGCVGVTADYSIREDGRIRVLNTCIENSLDGESRTIEGVARAADSTNAKLKVTFFWPFEGDYWILELGNDYEYALIGEPGRNFLWILSRTPTLDDQILEGIFSRLPSLGYDVQRLIMVEHNTESTSTG